MCEPLGRQIRKPLSSRAYAIDQWVEGEARGPAAPRVGDRTSPDEIRDRFGLSKKAFKRAIGRLLKDGAVAIDADGLVTVTRK